MARKAHFSYYGRDVYHSLWNCMWKSLLFYIEPINGDTYFPHISKGCLTVTGQAFMKETFIAVYGMTPSSLVSQIKLGLAFATKLQSCDQGD